MGKTCLGAHINFLSLDQRLSIECHHKTENLPWTLSAVSEPCITTRIICLHPQHSWPDVRGVHEGLWVVHLCNSVEGDAHQPGVGCVGRSDRRLGEELLHLGLECIPRICRLYSACSCDFPHHLSNAITGCVGCSFCSVFLTS